MPHIAKVCVGRQMHLGAVELAEKLSCEEWCVIQTPVLAVMLTYQEHAPRRQSIRVRPAVLHAPHRQGVRVLPDAPGRCGACREAQLRGVVSVDPLC